MLDRRVRATGREANARDAGADLRLALAAHARSATCAVGAAFGGEIVDLMLREEAGLQLRAARTILPDISAILPPISLAKVDLPLPLAPISPMRSSALQG